MLKPWEYLESEAGIEVINVLVCTRLETDTCITGLPLKCVYSDHYENMSMQLTEIF